MMLGAEFIPRAQAGRSGTLRSAPGGCLIAPALIAASDCLEACWAMREELNAGQAWELERRTVAVIEKALRLAETSGFQQSAVERPLLLFFLSFP